MACSLMDCHTAVQYQCRSSSHLEQIYDKATSAVPMMGSKREWIETTVEIRQGCLLSATLFNSFLERIMSDALEEYDRKVSIGGRKVQSIK